MSSDTPSSSNPQNEPSSSHQDQEVASLSTIPGILTYLAPTAFAASEATRLSGGTTNYVFRLLLRTPYAAASRGVWGSKKRTTAILKYAAPSAVIFPNVPFSVNRQRYEARALREIPATLLQEAAGTADDDIDLPALSAAGGDQRCLQQEAEAQVLLPELYMEDPVHNIIITEDIAPPPTTPPTSSPSPSHPISTTISIPLLKFLKPAFISGPSKSKVQTAQKIGRTLGKFLARVHAWGRDDKTAATARKLFAGNSAASETCVETTFRTFIPAVKKHGVALDLETKGLVAGEMKRLAECMLEKGGTMTMGDFWSGNVFAVFQADGESKSLDRLYVIDWEFANFAPTFTDIGHFLAEMFFDDLLQTDGDVAREMVVSFLDMYGQMMGKDPVDVRGVVGYMGSHIGSFVGGGNWADAEARGKSSSRAVEMVKSAAGGNWDAQNLESVGDLFRGGAGGEGWGP